MSDRTVREAKNRLAGFNRDRDRILAEVERRVTGRLFAAAERGGDASLEYALNDVCYAEIHRLEAAGRGARTDLERWRALGGRLRTMSDDDKRRELRDLVRHYGKDIVGNFDTRVYRFANDVLPAALGFLFSPVAGLREGVRAARELDAHVQVEGELDVLRDAAERGTLIVTPTHSSNMDSVVIGFALERAGLPPCTYGAGKNLFTNPFISFFMRNLGAYRVDRRLRFGLYKEVLKEYSTVLLESGYHSLFFPGGTRCRSNEVERHLKLGLLGTTVTAYRNNVRAGAPHKRLYVVPTTINYRLVLEAATLIDDYLAEVGKSRYIIDDDEFSRIGRIVEFVRKILVLEGSVVVRFGRPLDPFGNDVDDDGESIDRAGRRVDPASYLRGADGEITDDDQRDGEYTKLLGRRLAEVYPRETVFHSTHVVARALFDYLATSAGTRDIYRILRVPASLLTVPWDRATAGVAEVVGRIVSDPAAGRLHGALAGMAPAAIIEDALRALGSYHTRPIVERHGDLLVVGDPKLLFYYQNRTSHVDDRRAAARPDAELRPARGLP
ncbi:MAG: 1-acyl-sn-glycerol-3-phosphate acyltransferase [Myxococcales bacterium]|nr:1-acyl-sn-glycerol-3-phosphate acyltransferase [Myxococcales bacterium]